LQNNSSEGSWLPVQAANRVTNLDSIRGFAVLGILFMNVVSFGLPSAGYFNISTAGLEGPLDWAIAIFGEIFFDQKMMGLFSILFGAGIVMFADGAEVKGHGARRLSVWRNTLLLGIGVLHSLLWEGDVLLLYALCAPLVLFLRKSSPRKQLIVGIAAVSVSIASGPLLQFAIPPNGEGLEGFWFVSDAPMSDVVGSFFLFNFGARAFGMMMIGVALFRWNVLSGGKSISFYRKMAVLGLGLGLPFAVGGVVFHIINDFSPRFAFTGEAPNSIATIPVTLGYIGLITLWNKRGANNLRERLNRVGRMALSNYLMQTVIGVTVLRGIFELGYFNRTTLFLFVITVWGFQLVFADSWLGRFQFGPCEWVWRCATYRKLQPLRINLPPRYKELTK
jgi:uncharacterized protein